MTQSSFRSLTPHLKRNSFKLKAVSLLAIGALAALPVHGIVHRNAADTAIYEVPPTDPSLNFPWDNVGKMCNTDGSGLAGTVVSMRGRYCLTVNHLIMRSHVTFDGVTFYRVDPEFTPIQIGIYDLKVFKLLEDPGLPELSINTYSPADSNSSPKYLVGWGVGKLPTQSAPITLNGYNNVWRWGDGSTSVKRWGSNRYASSMVVVQDGYQYSSIGMNADYNAPDESEAALTQFDSGSALFLYRTEQWHITGIGARVSNIAGSNTTAFGTAPTNSDVSRWVRLQPVRTQILNIISEDSDFENWLASQGIFGPDSAYDADPDGDGITNLAAYAFGCTPGQREPEAAPKLTVGEGNDLVFRYRLGKNTQGITTQILHSADMVNWSPAPGTPVVVDDSSPDYTVYELSVSPQNDGHRFYTVKVSTN